MTRPDLLLGPAEREQVAAFLEPRVESSGAGDASDGAVREALRFLNRDVMGAGVTACGPKGDLMRVAETIATAAWCDMSAAFSLWCHRMVLEYLSSAPPGSPLEASTLPDVLGTRLLGSTALAGAMARHVGGAPLSVEWRPQGDAIVLNGRVSWASNLFPPDFVMVTAAANADDGRELIVALAGDTPGVCIEPYPRLLALQATGSSSVLLRDVRLPASWVIAEDFASFITRVRPTFLLLQSSFCWGLAARALAEARTCLRGVNEVFCADVEALEGRSAELAGEIRAGLSRPAVDTPIRPLVQLRLDCAHLATAAVALEAKATGGRGYVTTSPTARRLREAAFLPVQAPTEGQLRWELSRSA